MADDSAAVVEQDDVDTAQRVTGRNVDWRPEGAVVPRCRKTHSRLIVGRREPGDRKLLSVGCDSGTVDRATGDFPTVIRNRSALRPARALESSYVDVANLAFVPVPVYRDRRRTRDSDVRLAAVANAIVDERCFPDSLVRTDHRRA